MGKDKTTIKILCVDDEVEILDIYENILNVLENKLSAGKYKLDEDVDFPIETLHFELKTCTNGTDAIVEYQKSVDKEDPYVMCFLDIRMPSGPDGLWTGRKITEINENAFITMVTAYSDFTAREIMETFNSPECKINYIQKPFALKQIQDLIVMNSVKWAKSR
jgi:DNA-binding NtrC family response regulator